jgi:cadmium resistance protein CadD (predicted permease)
MKLIISAIFFSSLARAAFRALGFTVVAYVGMETMLGATRTMVMNSFQAVPGDVAGFLGMIGVDIAINLILSGFAARIALSVWSSIRP